MITEQKDFSSNQRCIGLHVASCEHGLLNVPPSSVCSSSPTSSVGRSQLSMGCLQLIICFHCPPLQLMRKHRHVWHKQNHETTVWPTAIESSLQSLNHQTQTPVCCRRRKEPADAIAGTLAYHVIPMCLYFVIKITRTCLEYALSSVILYIF